MARPLYLWLPGLIAVALGACSGTDAGFFSPVLSVAGVGGASPLDESLRADSGSSGSAPLSGSSGGSAHASSGRPGSDAQSGGSDGSQTGGSASGASAGPSKGGAGSGGRNGAGGTAGNGAAGRGAGGTAGPVNQAGNAGTSEGSAGAGGKNQDSSCSELIKQATQQLAAARVCDVDADSRQCTGKVTNRCGCEVPVQKKDSPETKAYLKTLKLLEDKDCAAACSSAECAPVDKPQCRAASSSGSGMCSAGSDGPRP